MAKILIFTAIIAIIYVLFFRKKSAESRVDSAPRAKNAESENALEMVECEACGTFIAKEEALKKEGKYFCKDKCKV